MQRNVKIMVEHFFQILVSQETHNYESVFVTIFILVLPECNFKEYSVETSEIPRVSRIFHI